MSTSALVFVIAGVVATLLTILLTGLSRHKKSSPHRVSVIGAIGAVEIDLNPEGAVIVNGELWRARLQDGPTICRKARVRVVGVQGHLLLVESVSESPDHSPVADD